MNKYFTVNGKLDSHIIVHIPHSSLYIPHQYKNDYLLSAQDLEEETKVMADMFTDDLYGTAFETFGGLRLDVSRIFLDVERFRDDNLESMAKRGMGLAYVKTSMLKDLRTLKYKNKILEIYDAYHAVLDDLVEKKLQRHGKCLIIDCHSFPSKPRPYQIKTDYDDIDICIGFEDFHKDDNTVFLLETAFKERGYRVAFNDPYIGSMVSNKHFGKNNNVKSVMLELNRKIYMDDIDAFIKNENYNKVKAIIEEVFERI